MSLIYDLKLVMVSFLKAKNNPPNRSCTIMASALRSSRSQKRDSDGFQLVTRKRGHKHDKAQVRPAVKDVTVSDSYSGPPTDKIIKRVQAHRESIRQTRFYKEMTSNLKCSSYTQVICYGIGHIGTCPIAQQQFALLLELCPPHTPCSLYDPVLCSEELSAVKRSGCTLRPNNELCKHRVDCPTLFYMPHCGRAMYNNLLWSNWSTSSLSHVTIVGNRLSSYQERISTDKLLKETPYIHNILPFCNEFPIPNSYHDNTVFNDLAIHTFSMDKLNLADNEIWTDCTEPAIDYNDPELVVS